MVTIGSVGTTATNGEYTTEVKEVEEKNGAKETQTSSSTGAASKGTEEDAYVDTSTLVDDTEDDDSYTYYKDGRKASHTVVDDSGDVVKEVKYNYDSNKDFTGKTVTKDDRTTEYDSDNKKVSSTRTYEDKNGDEVNESKTYDDNGRTKTRTLTNSKGEVIQEDTNYVYDKNGKVKSKDVTKNGETETRTYTYDKNGKKATMSTGNKTVYYDEDGNKTKTEKTYKSGGKTYTEIIKYDENGKVKSKVIKDSKGNIVSKNKNYEYDENGKVKSKTVTKNGKTRQLEYEYDSSGNLIKKTVKDTDGNVLRETSYDDYKENEDGTKTRRSEIKDADGNVIGYREQKLDENNKVTESKVFDENNKLQKKVFRDENRQITRVLSYGTWEKNDDGTKTRKCEIKDVNGDIVGYRIDVKDDDGKITRSFQDADGKESKRSEIMND